jgi:hypothetical protein
MKPQLQKLLANLMCAAFLGACDALPVSFESLSEKQRIQIGSDALLVACEGRDVETPWTFRDQFAFNRSRKYLDFIERSAKVGELSKYLTDEAQKKCFGPDLFPEFGSNVRNLIYRTGSDSEVVAAFEIEFRQISVPTSCSQVSREYPEDIKRRIDSLICVDSEKRFP